jgi:RNA polymerase sigma-70 factor (ECF subfamily)
VGSKSNDAPAPEMPGIDLHADFEAEAIPLRKELLSAARRYTSNFHDAEDLVSETYVKAWIKFETFDRGTNVRAWLYRIMINTWIDGHRRLEIRPRENLTDSFTDTQLGAAVLRHGTALSPEEHKLREVPSEALQAALQSLSSVQQVVVYYADICQLPYKVIADVTGMPVGTVMSSVHRARYRLRAVFIEARDRSA